MKPIFYWNFERRIKIMSVYVLIDKTNGDNEVIGVYDEWTKAQDKGIEISGSTENDFEIEVFDVE